MHVEVFVSTILMDTEFKKVKDKVELAEVNITAASKHVG